MTGPTTVRLRPPSHAAVTHAWLRVGDRTAIAGRPLTVEPGRVEIEVSLVVRVPDGALAGSIRATLDLCASAEADVVLPL